MVLRDSFIAFAWLEFILALMTNVSCVKGASPLSISETLCFAWFSINWNFPVATIYLFLSVCRQVWSRRKKGQGSQGSLQLFFCRSHFCRYPLRGCSPSAGEGEAYSSIAYDTPECALLSRNSIAQALLFFTSIRFKSLQQYTFCIHNGRLWASGYSFLWRCGYIPSFALYWITPQQINFNYNDE